MSTVTDLIRVALEIDREAWEERGEVVPVEEQPTTHNLWGQVVARDVASGRAYEYEVQERGQLQDRVEQDGETTVHVLATHYECMAGEARHELDTVVVGSCPEGPFGEPLDRTPQAWLVSSRSLR